MYKVTVGRGEGGFVVVSFFLVVKEEKAGLRIGPFLLKKVIGGVIFFWEGGDGERGFSYQWDLQKNAKKYPLDPEKLV